MDREIITTQSVANGFVDVDQLVLEDTPRTKTVFKASMHAEGVRGDIIRYRKKANGDCEDVVTVNFNELHPDDSIKITLRTNAVLALFQKIDELYVLLAEHGIHYGRHTYAITDSNALVITDENKAQIIQRLLDANFGEEVWAQIAETHPDMATRLAHSQIQIDRAATLQRFEEMLRDTTLDESDWQDFFENNMWIFGYGLRYQILRLTQAQPNYGGTDITGTGGERGDFLTHTAGDVRFTCLVEIKKPNTHLLQTSAYRNGVWGISNELSGAVSQVQVNCAQWEIEGARTDRNRDRLENLYTIAPRGIVVVGQTSQLNNRDKKNSFERYRCSLSNPEIITFDELYERAKFIVGEIETEDEDLPF